ncbi:ATP-binding protein [Sulfurimonas sp.]
MINTVPNLVSKQDIFVDSKQEILTNWLSYESPKEILKLHNIDSELFITKYAGGVFDYFMGVIAGKVEIGNCPVMQSLLSYLKDREISAEELFQICNHFKKSMVVFTYDSDIDSREIYEEISYIFDENFRGILKYYTDTIFQKLIDARQDALKAGQAKEYFLSNMSHEIRTPLNAILGFVNLLIDEDVSKKQRNYLDIIQNSGENLLSLMNDILDFSKLRSGEFTVEPKIFSLHDEISHTMELFVASAASKDITITSFIDPVIPKELFADALRIKQILSNFLSNAIKFTDKGGIISIEASCDNKVLKVSVTDNGIGIEQKDIKNIFTAFAQAQFSVLSSHAGTGLGLSICHQLADLMGGSVNAESEVGKGSTFWMHIPVDVFTDQCKIFDDLSDMQRLKIGLYTQHEKIPFQYESLLKYANAFGMNMNISNTIENSDNYDICVFIHEDVNYKLRNSISNTEKKYIALMSKDYDEYDTSNNIVSMCFPLYCAKIYDALEELLSENKNITFKREVASQFIGHILIAEDNEANQELIKILLAKYGLTFDLAQNGLEALELYKNNSYDLILMDEQMPIMDGNESVKEIIKYENDNKLRHTPISALTANVIKGARERGLLNGFDSFLGKPIIIKDLERVFATYLKISSKNEDVIAGNDSQYVAVVGLDINKLREELLLSTQEIVMLLNLFINKMKKSIPELERAIDEKDYQKMQVLAHGIKGSSANFRMDDLLKITDEFEKMAKQNNSEYDYKGTFENIKKLVEEIAIR